MAKKTKLLIILSRIIIGGPANFVEFLSINLDKKKYDVILVGGAVDEGELNKAEALKKMGLDVRLISSMKRKVDWLQDIRSVFEIYRIIKQEKPDIVSTHTAKAGAVGRSAAVLARVPVILHTFHGHTFEHYFSPLVTWVYIHVEKILARFSTRIITISPSQLTDLSGKFKIAPKSKFEIVRIAIDTGRFRDLDKDDQLRKSLGIPLSGPVIGLVARLVPIKNIPMIFKVIKNLHVLGIDAHLVLVGDGEKDYKDFLLKTVRDLELIDYVHFIGWFLEVEKIYTTIDVFALTSLNEGTPVTILEALAAKVPVVATDVGGVKDILLDNQNGLLCRPDDADDMAEKIKRLLHNPDLCAKLAENGVNFVKEYYDYKKMIKNVNGLYTELSRQYNSTGKC